MIVGAGAVGSPRDAMVPKMMIEFLPPFLVGLAAVGLIAAAQSTAAPYVSSFAAMATRNLVGTHLINKEEKRLTLSNGGNPPEKVELSKVMTEGRQVFLNRTFATLILVLAFLVAYFNPDLIVMLGGLAVSYAWQLFPALVKIVYGWPRWFTGKALAWGLLVGFIAVTVFYWFPAFRYPLAIHTAGWGILFNFITIIIVSVITSHTKRELTWGEAVRELFRTHDTDFYTPGAQKWQKFALFYMPFWWIMWVGPGQALAPLFDGWLFGAPGMWFWIMLGWGTGVFMLWSMAFKAKLATPPPVTPEPIDEEAKKTLTLY